MLMVMVTVANHDYDDGDYDNDDQENCYNDDPV